MRRVDCDGSDAGTTCEAARHRLAGRFIGGRARRAGQVTVEFALVLPFLLTLIFGVFELSWLFYQDHTINFAARLAARTAAVCNNGAAAVGVRGSDLNIRALVKSYCNGFGLTDAQISIKTYLPETGVQTSGTGMSGANGPGTNRKAGEDIEVEITHNIMFLTFIQSIFKQVNVTTLKATAQFVEEF